MKRLALVGLMVGCTGCASTPRDVRQYDYCQATDVNSVTDADGSGSWIVKCVNQWELLQTVIFNTPVNHGDKILYIPFKENDGGDLHGYIKSVNGKDRA